MIQAKEPGKTSAKISPSGAHESVLSIVPNAHGNDFNHGQHFVQFYETDTFLVNSLKDFVAEGLRAGDGVVVVVDKPHRNLLEYSLSETGIDLMSASATGQYVALDAAATLAGFMVNSLPDASLFKQSLRPVIKDAGANRRGVRAFGEMVALLWTHGNTDGAIRLEELWNDLQNEHPFVLFCAYPFDSFKGSALTKPLWDVCTRHSHVIPSESYTQLKPDDRLRTIIELQQKAKSLELEIAERKQAEEALRKVKEELQQQLEMRELLLTREQVARVDAENANRMKDEFLATVSHELRTPLNAIIGWSHMLRSGRLDAKTTERALQTIDRNAKAQAQLVEDILDVSRIITGKLRLNMVPVDLAAVINEAVESVQLAAETKGIKLAITLDPPARWAHGDASRLQQVVWNLLANAIKFTSAGGQVEVSLIRNDGLAEISISDSGQGINRDFLPFIFDRFRQADGTSTRQHGGLGLGLAIVRHLVELHGGTVSADSQGIGTGSRFTIRIPVPENSNGARPRKSDTKRLYGRQSSETTAANLPSVEGVKVLLVDDDRDTLNLLTVFLVEQRANVEVAASVNQALEVLQWFEPDVIVSDLAMPNEDGYALIEKIRMAEQQQLKERQTPVVALTAFVRVEDRARALSAGFNMFVPKPLEPNELINAIASLVEPATPLSEQT